MKRWPTKTLGELCDVRIGRTPRRDQPRYWGGNVVWVTIAELNGGEIASSKETISEAAVRECMPDPVPTGTLLFSFKLSIGKMAVAGRPLYTNEAIAALPIRNPREISRDFLRYALLAESREGTADKAVLGKLLNKDKVQRLTVPVPPLAEQDRLVKLLDEADALRKLRADADKGSEALIPALFNEMFGDPRTNPKRWPRESLKECGASVRYGLGQPPEGDPRGVPILRATNIKRGRISETGLMRVRREAIPASRNAFLAADEVLVVRSGAYTGDVARVGEEWAGAVAGYDLVVSPGEQLVGDLVASFLLSDFVQNGYFNGLKQRAAQPHLNSTQLEETPFLRPPIELQRMFASRVEEIRRLRSAQAKSAGRLDGLFQTMLHHAFSGGL